MATNDFLSFAGGSGANVLSQTDYAALAALSTGFTAGVAQSNAINKALRQSSIMSAVLAQFVADQTGANSTDDGTTATLLSNLKKSMPGRYLGSQVFTSSGTYTPGTYNGVTATKARFRGVAAGGGSGGTVATGASQGAASAASNSGNVFDFLLAPLTTLSITVGAAGAAGTGGAAGGTGGDLVIGSIATIKGGKGSAAGNLTGSFPQVSNPTATNTASTISGAGVTVLQNQLGQAGTRSVMLALGTTLYGVGGSNPFGAGGVIDQLASGCGSGACGVSVAASTAAQVGLAGTGGLLIVDEYA